MDRHASCMHSLVEKRGEKLSKGERKLRAEGMKEILKEERELSDRFFELVIEAEKKALKERFW